MRKSLPAIPPAAGPYSANDRASSNHRSSSPPQVLNSSIPNTQQSKSIMKKRRGSVRPIPTPNREERKIHYGIDCADLVHFAHWEPGGEHVKSLIVKNVVMKTQKIKYKLPKTRFFSMEFPETVTLSAGMSWTIPVTFRPVAKETYTDVIEFTTSFGKFNLPIKATLPEHVLEYPAAVDFSLCPLRETARRIFQLKNVGELASSFEWEISRPFVITPRTGVLTPGQTMQVAIEFQPEDASVFTANAVCHFGDRTQWERSKVTQGLTVYGIGKYSHMAIEGNNKEFNFGDVYVGRKAEKKLVLVNNSSVSCNFKINQAEKNTDPYFEFSILAGTVAPGKKLELTVTYIPVASGISSTDYFDITSVSGNTIRIVCYGNGVGPSVTLNTKLVNFNDVPASTTVMRPIYIQNNTTIDAFYQFLAEPNSIFRIDKPWGTIGPNSSVALTIKFSPVEPINYYRRVYCLVDNQDALFIDMIGTCYNEKRRPATFHPRQLENYKHRVTNGLWSFGPEHLEEMLKNGTIQCDDGVLRFINKEKHKIPREILDFPYNDGLVSSEYFYENTGSEKAVSLLDTYIDFGSCSKYRIIETQVIRISNNTKGKMSCVWYLPGDLNNEDPVFSVTPTITDISPRSTVEFRVHFRPKTDNSFYGQQLECFVYFKSMRNFRLVNEDTFTPPWCLTPTVAGNTFPAGEDTFIPKIEFGATRLDFPACHVDKTVYRTMKITNAGDTPVKFAFADTQFAYNVSLSGSPVHTNFNAGIGGSTPLSFHGGAPFSVKPRIGLLHKNESRLVVFRFSPSEQKTYEQGLKCYFNSSLSNNYDLQMRGIGAFPQLVFENQNTLFFKPTCVGTLAQKPFYARNTSRIPITFEWKIPTLFSGFVSIEPVRGILKPNSSIALSCSFCPALDKNWLLRIPCYYSHAHEENELSHESRNKRTTLTVIGTGADACITAEPQILDLDAILVNTVVERDILLLNMSDCDIFYNLEIYKLVQDPDEEGCHKEILITNNIRESEIEVIQSMDLLPARSNHVLKLRSCIRDQVRHEFRIYYIMKPYGKNIAAKTSLHLPQNKNMFHLCDIKVLGVHPVVRVTDIRSEGVSKSLLWKYFSLENFNEVLKSTEDLTENTLGVPELEEDFDFPTEGVTGGEYKEPPSLDFNFGSAPIGSPASVVHMSIINPGVVPVEWVYYFPNDLEVEIENWADPGDYTEEQLHTNLILDNGLFSITPKTGVLHPGESTHIVMAYNHKFPGLHKLPVVFKLKNGSTRAGKELVLYYVGYTIPLEQKCLYLPSSHHPFNPVSIGTSNPPIQTYRLENTGLLTLNYTIDISPLNKLKSENDFEVFVCKKSSGTIAPGDVEYIEWIFRPLEVKEYSVDIPIMTDDGQTSIVTFIGHGLEEPTHESLIDPREDHAIPPVQILPMVNQIAVLSKEHINFGSIPLGVQLRELLVIRNTSDSKLSFKWIFPASAWGSSPCICINPTEGFLYPGESRFCKLIFSPAEVTRIYNLDVQCQILNETQKEAYDKFQEKLLIAQREGTLALDPRNPFVSQRQLPNSAGKPKVSLRGAKYNALPDITSKSIHDVAASVPDMLAPLSGTLSNKPLDSGIDFAQMPSQPEPYPLFVSINAQSYPVDNFRSIFNGDHQFFHQQPSTYKKIKNDPEAFADISQMLLYKETLKTMLDDIMQDSEIQCLIQPENVEPLPFFAQFSIKKRNGIFAESINGNLECHNTATEILSAIYFQNWVESILEQTIHNLIQEAHVGDFDITKDCLMLWMEQDKPDQCV